MYIDDSMAYRVHELRVPRSVVSLAQGDDVALLPR